MPDYSDDETISDDEILWRRIPPWHIVLDHNAGSMRPSSAAFEDGPSGHPMSVLISSIMQDQGRGPQHAIQDHRGFALAGFTARTARECGLGVARDPLPKEPAHGLVFGKKTQSVRRKIAKAATWVVEPSVQADG